MITSDALQLLKIFGQNTHGNARWADADLARIYGQSSPDIDVTVDELLGEKLIKSADKPLGRRKTDLFEITDQGVELLAQTQREAS